MKNRILFSLAVALLVGCLAAPLQAAAVRSWDIDRDHSNIFFSIDHIFAKVHGRFTDFTGTFLFDPDNLKDSAISFAIKVKSIDTGIGKRDKHLLSDEFFDESQFPLMTFTSTSITKAGENTYNVNGKLTIKGVTYDLLLPLVFAGKKDHPVMKGTEVAGFNGTVTLDRLAYKVGNGKFYQMGLIGKEVEVQVTLELLSKK